MFSVDTYVKRRQKLKDQLKSGVILLLGNEESPMNYAGNTYRFRQDSTFLYFFGLDYPGLAGVLDLDEGRDRIFGNDLAVDEVVWMGTRPAIKAEALRAGIKNTASLFKLAEVLAKAKGRNRTIHFLPPYRAETKLKLDSLLGIRPAHVNDAASIDLIKAVVDLRSSKSEEEIQEIEKAVNISVEMHLRAMKMVKPGMREYQVAAEIEKTAIASGGQLAFPVIATVHGEILHSHCHGNQLKSGDMFLMDAGAETGLHYAGDLSSTIPVDPKFTDRQREIYQVVLAAHEKALSLLKPGTYHKQIHLAACKTIAQGMKGLGFMKGDVDEAVEQGAHALFFPCGLGHMLGLDVHDMENLGEAYVGYDGQAKSAQFGLKSLRLARILEPGFVLTVEPGIYFIPELIDMWKSRNQHSGFLNYDKIEQYKDFGGIRIEENAAITRDGVRVLGKPKPKSIEEIEAQRG